MRSRLARICGYGFGVLTMVIAIQGQLLAGTVPIAPEIDGSLVSAGLGLLAGGILILRSRRGSK
jgi:hypothetical protein